MPQTEENKLYDLWDEFRKEHTGEFQLASRWELKILKILRDNGLCVENVGVGTGIPSVIERDPYTSGKHPDLLIKHGGNEICFVEVTGSRRKRDKFLIQSTKVERFSKLEIPTFFTFYIDESNEIFWCEASILQKYAPRIIMTNWSGRKVPQRVILSTREEWHRGIQSLIKVIRHLIEEAERYG